MLTCVTAVSGRLPDQPLGSLAREQGVDQTVKGNAQQGTHTELMAQGGLYARLHELQFSRAEQESALQSALEHAPGE